MTKLFLFMLLGFGLCAGCSTTVTVLKAPKVDLGHYRRIFVVQPLNENHHVDELFVEELRRSGRVASSGPITMLPEETDAVLVYQAQWTGDFFTSLLDLTVELSTAHTDKKLAEARYYQPSARPKKPDVVVRSLIERIFGQ